MSSYSKAWYVLYTRSKHEKKLQFLLGQRNITSYLPMISEIRQWSDRKKIVEGPMFPSYLFVHTGSNKLWSICEIPGAVRFLGIGKTPSPIKDSVIESLQIVEKENLEIKDYKLLEGDRVKVTGGKFLGVEGTYLRKGAKNMLAIAIEIMNRIVLVELKSDQIKKLQRLNSDRIKASI